MLPTVLLTSLAAIAFSPMFPRAVVVMLPPLVLLFVLNNYGLRESVQVSKTIFLVNLGVMGITILAGLAYVMLNGVQIGVFLEGVTDVVPEAGSGSARRSLPGLLTLGAALIPVALGSSILGASGVESVMNIPEELERPRRDIRRIYRVMLTILS